MRFSDEKINEIRNSADIVDVVGHYLTLTRSGRNYKAICPFHDDTTPSLNISTSKQIYKCFSCGAGGNVFTFVSNYEKVDFVESVFKVAEITGQVIDVDMSSYKQPKDPLKQPLYKVLDETIKFTMYQLNASNAVLIKNYLNDRGIPDDLIEMFQIGYNGDNNELYKFLSAKGYQDKDMVSANVVRINELGAFDVFGKRITFPIHDTVGNPIGFTARSMDENVSKYINTSETRLFIKGHIVYNYHRAKTPARKEGSLIIVEGVTDVIAFAKAKMFNVVATLGTACTIQQILAMKNASNKLIFCYDGDNAGQNATFKAAKLAMDLKVDVKIVKNTSNLDPDEIIKQQGTEGLITMVKKEMTWLEFCFEYYLKKYNLDLYSEKKEFAKKILEEINKSDDRFDKENFLFKLRQVTGFKLNDVNIATQKKKETTKQVATYKKAYEGRLMAERLIVASMLSSVEAINTFKEKLGFLIDTECDMLARLITSEHSKGNSLEIADILDKVSDESQKKILLDISSEEIYKGEYTEENFISFINRVKKWIIEDNNESLRKQIQIESNPKIKEELMIKYRENLIELRRYNIEKD